MESTRYSLVKGERIVRFVLTTWLRGLSSVKVICIYSTSSTAYFSQSPDVGLLKERTATKAAAELILLFVGFYGPGISLVFKYKGLSFLVCQ